MISDIVAGLGAGVGVDASPDGSEAYVVEWSNGWLVHVDVQQGAISTVLTNLALPQDVLVDWEGSRRIFVSERTGAIREVFSHNESREVARPGGAPHQLALSRDGQRLYTVCYDSGQLQVVDLASGSSTVVASGLGHPVGLVIDDSESVAYVTEQDTARLSTVDLSTAAITGIHSGLVAPFFLAWDRDRTGLYCVQRDPQNSLIHLKLGTPVSVLGDTTGLDWRPSGVAPAQDDDLIFVATDRKLQVISAAPVTVPPPPPPPFTVESIEFDHDGGEAIPLQYHGQGPVPTPEWTTGSTSHPAAYPMATLAHLRVVFRGGPGYVPGSYAVGATGSLGGIRRQVLAPVFSPSGISAPVTMETMWPLPATVDARTVTWIWDARPGTGAAAPAPIGSTVHRIYTVLRRPVVAPWDRTRPWVAALERACSWAAGSVDADGAAGAVTRGYNESGTISYDTVSGATVYALGTFSLAEMLERLDGGMGLGGKVNCTDSAATVSTLANVLGCELWQARMGDGFQLNEVVAIGYNTWEVPFGYGFSYHEVAWKGSATDLDAVFDGCLRVDGDPDPDNGPHTPLLPVNMVFGSCNSLEYKRRLCPPTQSGCANCSPTAGSKQRRPIA